MSKLHDTGMATRRSVLGDAHVGRAEAARTPLDAPFQDMICEGAWGTVWASDAITRRERSMLTLALLAATGNFDEIEMHVRATARTVQTELQYAAAFGPDERIKHSAREAALAASVQLHEALGGTWTRTLEAPAASTEGESASAPDDSPSTAP